MKSAQQKFNEYLDECRETSDAVNQFVESSYDNYKSYGHAAGALITIVCDLIADLPKAKRAEMRQRLYNLAQKQKNELLAKTIKEA